MCASFVYKNDNRFHLRVDCNPIVARTISWFTLVMFSLCLCVCLSTRYRIKLQMNLMIFFRGTRWATDNRRLDVSDDPKHSANHGFYENFWHRGIGTILRFLPITEEVTGSYYWNFWRVGVGCLTSNKPLDFGADRDHDPDRGIFNRIFTSDRQRQL